MIDMKITITATLVDHNLSELQKKLEACVMDFLGEHINPIAERTPDGEPDTWYDVTIKEV